MNEQIKRKQLHRRQVVQPARRQKRAQQAARIRPSLPCIVAEPGYAAFLRRVEDVEIGCKCDIEELLALGD